MFNSQMTPQEYAFGLADTNRYLVHQGWLTLVPGTRSTIQGKLVYSFDQLATYLKSQTNQVYVFLFNDLILFTKVLCFYLCVHDPLDLRNQSAIDTLKAIE